MVLKRKNRYPTPVEPSVNGSALIHFKDVSKIYKTDAGDFPALKQINLKIQAGEFVSVIGKSGSGKTTLINMLTGIDRPSEGEITIGGVQIHALNEGQMARWRGQHMGVVFQFFQLLPTLSVVQNVMIPMDFCDMYEPEERRKRAMRLLEMVGIAEHANKPPSRLSGGQQQRAAIARALANDPPIIATDEPTGNLDSKTANQIFDLFEKLVEDGKTILMVTHDEDLAQLASRTVIISDGEIVNEYLAKAMPSLSHELLLNVTKKLNARRYAPGEVIIQQGALPDWFYIITEGEAKVYLSRPNGREVFVDRLHAGQYFGEMALLKGGVRQAMVRSCIENPVSVVALDHKAFAALIAESEEARRTLEDMTRQRSETLATAEGTE